MLLTLVIAGVLFAAMVVMLWLGYAEREHERESESAALLASAPLAQPGHCLLCDAPLRRARNTDEVVHEVEERIHSELEDISAMLRSTPEKITQLYRA